MSLVVLDIQLIENDIIKELGVNLMVLHKDFHFVQQNLLNLIDRQHGLQAIYMELRGVVESWIMIFLCCLLRHKGNECRIVC